MRGIAAVIGCTLALAAHGVTGASTAPVEHAVEGTSQFHSDEFLSSLDHAEGEVEPVRLAVDEMGDADYSIEHAGGRRLSWWSIALQLSEFCEWRRRAFASFASTPYFIIRAHVISVHPPCPPHSHAPHCHDHGSSGGKMFGFPQGRGTCSAT